jgi:ABC1 atypical kinase-like domain
VIDVRPPSCGMCTRRQDCSSAYTLAASKLGKSTGPTTLQVLTRASEAYGRMILDKGLFQADGHPGNILVMKGGKVGLIDYGQSKQLQDRDRLLIAKLIIALNTCGVAAHALHRGTAPASLSRPPNVVPSQIGRLPLSTSHAVSPCDLRASWKTASRGTQCTYTQN